MARAPSHPEPEPARRSAFFVNRGDAASAAYVMLQIQRDRPQPDLPSPRPPLDPRGTCRPLRGGQPPWRAASQRGAAHRPGRPIALLATAIPSAATLSVAIQLVHALPEGAEGKLAAELLDTAETNAADALYRCHRTLELDGLAHGYTAEEWLPVIYDGAAPLLESSRLDQEPPSLVRQTQEAMRWLSSSIACLDEDLREAPAALTDTLARLLVVSVFADAARPRLE